jgi:hypothetical protein
MLRQLSTAFGTKPPEVVRRLIRDAYARKLPGLQSSAGFGFLELLPQPRRAVAGAKRKATPKKSAVKKKAPARPKKA